MYVGQLKNGNWAVCEDNTDIVCVHPSRLAAVRHKNEIARAERFDRQMEDDTEFFYIHGPFPKD